MPWKQLLAILALIAILFVVLFPIVYFLSSLEPAEPGPVGKVIGWIIVIVFCVIPPLLNLIPPIATFFRRARNLFRPPPRYDYGARCGQCGSGSISHDVFDDQWVCSSCGNRMRVYR